MPPGVEREYSELAIGLTDAGEIALDLPDAVPVYLTPDAARLMARSLVSVALEADRIRSDRN